MGKLKMRNLVIDNNGTSENWKWVITNSKIMVQKENGKKQFLDNPNMNKDKDCYTPITPGMIAEYIRTKILGLEPKVVEVKKPKVNSVVEPKVITKSKIYVIEKHSTIINEEYGDCETDITDFEYWLDPAKAKSRADELNQSAKDMFIYDELTSIYTYSKYWSSNERDELRFTTYEYLYHYKDMEGYKSVEKAMNKQYDGVRNSIGYEFRAVEKELNL